MQNKNSRPSGSAGAARTWPLAALAVAGIALAGWWWKGHGAAGAEGPAASTASGAAAGGARGGRFGGAGNRPQPVSVAAVQRRDLAVAVDAIGSIATANTAVVRAKVSGELKAIYFKEGQAVKAGQALALIDPRPFEIARDQAQAALARDQAQLENARADLTRYQDLVAKEAAPRQQLGANQPLPVQAWDREHKQMLAEGRVASTDNAIDASTGTIKVKALFANQDNTLFPNQFVNVRLQLDTLKDVLVVPTAAVQRGAPGTFVYVVADGQVALRKLGVLATDGESTAVRGELKPGDQVVTDGADRLRDGGKAEVIKAPGREPGRNRQPAASAATR